LRFALLVLLTLMSSFAFLQEDFSSARANKINGMLFFDENEPVESYEVSFTSQNDIGKENDLIQENIRESMVMPGMSLLTKGDRLTPSLNNTQLNEMLPLYSKTNPVTIQSRE